MTRYREVLKKYTSVRVLFIIALLIISISTFLGFTQAVSATLREGALRPKNKSRSHTDWIDIKGWMTFDYISKVYGLPSPVVLEHLPGNDVRTQARYPDISLMRYANRNHIPPQ